MENKFLYDMPLAGKDGRPQKVYLKVWDTTGKFELQDRVRNFYNGAKVALIVFSVDSQESFKDVDRFVESVNVNCGQECIKILLANKFDRREYNMRVQED